jgi:hypothetical protein
MLCGQKCPDSSRIDRWKRFQEDQPRSSDTADPATVSSSRCTPASSAIRDRPNPPRQSAPRFARLIPHRPHNRPGLQHPHGPHPGKGWIKARSETANRPPGLSTRAISLQTCCLFGDRLITQFEMTTSTDASATGRCSISPRRNSTLLNPLRSVYAAIFPRARLSISGVMSTPITRRSHPLWDRR